MNVDQREATPWGDLNSDTTREKQGRKNRLSVRVLLTETVDATFYSRETLLEGWQVDADKSVQPAGGAGKEGELLAGVECEHLGHPLDESGQKIAKIELLRITRCETNYTLNNIVVAVPSDQSGKLSVIRDN